MRTLPLLLCFGFATALVAQSPLSLPYNSNNGLGASAGVFFDLNVIDPSGVQITALDVNSSSTAGTAGTVEVYTKPTTYVGSQQVPGAWTLAGVGACISAGTNLPSPVCLGSGGFYLAPGSYGVCVRHVGLAIRYTDLTATTTTSNSELSMSAGQSATMATPFSSAPIANRQFNGSIYYNVGPVPGPFCPAPATKVQLGTGCYGPFGDSWYENFAGLVNVDLAGTAGNETVIVATPAGPVGYAVTTGSPAWFAPVAPKLLSNAATPAALADDTMAQPVTLPFPFTFPGGTVTVMHANTNGFVHLGPTTITGGDYTPTPAEMHTLQPRLFALWSDWQAATNVTTNPASGVYYDVDPSGQTVYFTWLDVADRRGQVPAAGATSLTFQIAIHASGTVEYRYRSFTPAATGAGAVMVGYSKGNSNVTGGPVSIDAGNRDLTVAMPFVTDGPDTLPLTLDSNTPRLGQTWTITTTNVEPISPVGLLYFGSAPLPGVDLGFVGAPGCRAYQTADLTSAVFPVANGSFAVPLPVPNTVALAGLQLHCQSLAFTLRNTLNLATSNGLTGTIGL